jgi:hypothetical protein
MYQFRQLGIRLRCVNLQDIQDATIHIVQYWGVGRHIDKIFREK